MHKSVLAIAIGVGLLIGSAQAASAGSMDDVVNACTSEKAKLDDPEGLFCRGEDMFRDRQDADAYSNFLKSAEMGYAPAQTMAGLMLEHGDGVARDNVAALGWLLKAAEQGMAEAQNEYAYLTYYGYDNVAADPAAAVPWFRKAADQGSTNAQTMLAGANYNGEGVDKNLDEAFRLYKLAADHGHPYAMYMLGTMYITGEGTARDLKLAETWLVKAAFLGVPDAQAQLGDLYSAPGDMYDPVKAMTWFKVYMGNPDAEHPGEMDAVAAKLTPEQQSQAETAAAVIRVQINTQSQ